MAGVARLDAAVSRNRSLRSSSHDQLRIPSIRIIRVVGTPEPSPPREADGTVSHDGWESHGGSRGGVMGFLGDMPEPNGGVAGEIASMVEANEKWRASFEVGALGVRPVKHAVILTCMDSRYPAAAIIGYELGDAHTIRNAGGRATDDAIRSLIISAHALGTRACIVIHHTDCGLFGQTNDNLRSRVKSATGQSAAHIDFLPFADLEESVRDDVEQIRACRFLPEGYEVVGMIYDVRTGQVIPVDTPHHDA